MNSRRCPVLAKEIETTPEVLTVVMEKGAAFYSVGKVFRAARPCIAGRTRALRTVALRLRDPLAPDRRGLGRPDLYPKSRLNRGGGGSTREYARWGELS
jgi:hypothetical protein